MRVTSLWSKVCYEISLLKSSPSNLVQSTAGYWKFPPASSSAGIVRRCGEEIALSNSVNVVVIYDSWDIVHHSLNFRNNAN